VKLEHRLTVLCGLSAAAVVAATLTVAGPAAAAPARQAHPANVVSSSAQLTPDVAAAARQGGADGYRQALAGYWTADRMRTARPESDLPSVKAAAAASRTTSGQATAAAAKQGPAVSIPGAAPKQTPQPSGILPMSTNPNYPVGHPTARTAGKVFFSSGGVNYVCSGTIVNTEGKSSVWTAGHCVSDGGTWNTNWIFVPNYVSGSAPYGVWYAYQLWTTSAWFYNNNDFANDVGSAVMNRNSGNRITDYLGGQGIAWNQGTGYYMYAFGYPQAAPFNGSILIENDGYTYDNGDGTIYMLNDMTGGSSGGGWLLSFDGQWGYINGHNDFKYNAYPQYMFSPYYGNQVSSLYNTVRNLST
jgi:hypothetical protein